MNTRRFVPIFLLLFMFLSKVACGDADPGAIEVSLTPDRAVYDESETIGITMHIVNLSPKEHILKPRSEKDRNMLGLGVYLKDYQGLQIYPEGVGEIDSITIGPGEIKTFKYEFPAYRMIVYADPAREIEFNIGGPWIEDVPIPKTDLKIITDFRETPTSIYSGIGSINKYFLDNDIFINPEDELQKASTEDIIYISRIPSAVEFAEKNKKFDGLIFRHDYTTGGDLYREKIIILSSQGADIDTLILRTWPDRGPLLDLPWAVTSSSLQYPKLKSDAPRFKVEFKPASDFGYIRVYDNWGDQKLFDASSVWMGRGTLNFPENWTPIESLRSKQQKFKKRSDRDIYIHFDIPLPELEKVLYELDIKLDVLVTDNSALVLIPPDAERTKDEYIKLLEANEGIRSKTE